MENVARWGQADRSDLFRETSARRGMNPAVVEKDFWVCYVLSRLFASKQISPKIVFKGGTTLSKIFNLIERFSEDIDLILDISEVTDEDPDARRSITKQDRFNKQVVADSREYIRRRLLLEIDGVLGDICNIRVDEDAEDDVIVGYPAAFPGEYIRPEIRLEIGPLALRVPNDRYEIRSYASEEFSANFEQPVCQVRAIKAERTFWEKATILHQEAHRSEDKKQPLRYSRHYYDLARMAQSRIKEIAFDNLGLLRSVVDFKTKFYPSGWARYDTAVPGTFRLIPPEHVLAVLRRDYKEMQVMIFGDIPSFDDIFKILGELEREINNLG